MKENFFNIPIAIFLFKRSNTVLQIIKVLEKIKPKKLYLIGDGPRNKKEEKTILQTRQDVINAVTWDCEVITNFSINNRGVFQNIAGGAKWVLEREESAVFLEDDNLPEHTFFEYCKDLLEKYKYNDKIFWICGTNYLEDYQTKNNESYIFTQQLFPCGWATWSSKFSKYYDDDLKCLENEETLKLIKKQYFNNSLFKQQINSGEYELYRRSQGLPYASWDFQMALSIKANELFGISPKYNQIENIGVDEFSIHGGNSFSNEMTRRFCTIKTKPLEFPLVHPSEIKLDEKFEKRTEKIILFPLKARIKFSIAIFIKNLFGLNKFEKFNKEAIKNKWYAKKNKI
ncbi:hypothetical protein [Streptococcus porcinus]|uniref:Hemolytic protein HlpA-like protein n=1 Tax=Streptococcus porcinus str. Jelinkova 176 TaxID=873448 RepID=A0ABN0CTP9_STRPO|nr:hypothetical protein [Streptococcus porcinus]EGJ26519.1 hypothetical protein STRPO_0218 [Streptococcus porcinus str. Jelinkova 176]SQG43878.1 Uncharacterised protein [Streptococcus porcinus]